MDKALRLKNQSDEPVIDCRLAYHVGKSFEPCGRVGESLTHIFQVRPSRMKDTTEDRIGRNHMFGAMRELAGLRLI